MKFPSAPLSSINYESRDSFLQANKREFKMMKQQDNDDDTTSPSPVISSKKSGKDETLSSSSVLLELEKEISVAENYLIEIDEIIREWNTQHRYQFKELIIEDYPDFEEPGDFQPSERLRAAEVPLLQGEHEPELDYEARKLTPAYRKAQAKYNNMEEREMEKYQIMVAKKRIEHEQGEQDHEAEQFEIENTPLHLRFKSRDKSSNVHFDMMTAAAQRLLTTTAKLLTVVNNIKLIYKSKVSGNKLNRFDKPDMFKIQSVMDKFLRLGKSVARVMAAQPRAVLDSKLLLKKYQKAGKLEDDEPVRKEFHHVYDKAEQKFIKEINEIDTLYIADKERYSYNLGRY